MATAVSWVWSPLAGILCAVLTVVFAGGAIHLAFSSIGALRKRSAWCGSQATVVGMLVVVAIGHGVSWISGMLRQGDTVSGALFWAAVIALLAASVPSGVEYVRETWNETNGSPSNTAMA